MEEKILVQHLSKSSSFPFGIALRPSLQDLCFRHHNIQVINFTTYF